MTRSTRQFGETARPVEELLAAAGLTVLAIAGGVGLVLWAAGELAAVFTMGRLTGTSPSAALAIAIRFPMHLAEPALAWPAPTRSSTAGAPAFYAAFALLFSVIAGAVVKAVNWCVAWRAGHGRRMRDRSLNWAATAQVKALLVDGPTPGRVLLGRLGRRRVVAAEARRSVLVVAPTQAGKTTRFVVPNVLCWTGPLLVTSVKGDVLRLTAVERARRGGTHVFDPTGTAGMAPCRWSPLLACGTYADAERVAGWLVTAAGESHTDANVQFWEQLGAKLLGSLLFAAASTGRPISQVARWVDRREVDEVADALEELGDEDATDAFTASQSREDRQRDSVYATVETVLRAFTSPSVRAATEVTINDAGDVDVLDVEKMLDRGETLYLVAPAHEQARLRPLFESLVQSVVRAAQDRYAATGAPLDPPLLLMLDEAAHIAPIRDLAALAATGAGQGIQLCTIWQDLAQIETVYGRAATSVVNGHTARVLLAGSADLSTLDATSRAIGDHETVRISTSIGPDGQRSMSRSEQDGRLAPVEYLRQLPPDAAVVLYGRLPPLRVRTTPWWSDRHLRAMVEGTGGLVERIGGGPQAGPPTAVTTPPPAVQSAHDGTPESQTTWAESDTDGDNPSTVADLSGRSTWLDHDPPAPGTPLEGEGSLTDVQDRVDDVAGALAAQHHALNVLPAELPRQLL